MANDEGAANGGEEQAAVVESRECEKRREAAAGPVRTLVAIWIGDGTNESDSPA